MTGIARYRSELRPAVNVASPSLWAQTFDVDYMREDGRADHPSHIVVADQIRRWYADADFDFLDCGVMSGVTCGQLKKAGLKARYFGIDINRAILDHCRSLHPGARWELMSVADLAFPDESFEIVNCRHLLECLPYYETAVREIFRVARKHVVICMFQPPGEPEALLRRQTADGYIWLNRYAPAPFEALLDRLSSSVESVDVADNYRLNRVYLCEK